MAIAGFLPQPLFPAESLIQNSPSTHTFSPTHPPVSDPVASPHSIDVADPALYKLDSNQQISRKNRLIFVHVPKTGGSTIEASALFDDARVYHRVEGHSSISGMGRNFHERRLDTFLSFAFVRHPCSRMISAFNYLVSGNGNSVDQAFVDKHMRNMTLAKVVENMESEGSEGKAIREWMHFVPMHRYLFYHTGQFGLDMLFCQEHFSEAVKWLNEHYNDTLGEPKTHLKLDHQQCSELQEETRRNIERIFALDFCIFDYKTGQHGAARAESDGCVGARFTRKQFTERYAWCNENLTPIKG